MSETITSNFFLDHHEIVITKEMLKGLEVIGQVDKKFIATSLKHEGKRYLIVLDQHAVDERLRLEHLQKKFRKEIRDLKPSTLPEPLKITLFAGDATSRLLGVREDLTKSLASSGIRCAVRDVGGRISIVVTEFPLDLLRKITRKTDYLDYARETISRIVLNSVSKDRNFGGNFFAQVLASEACARAVKFGDPLTQVTMSNMLAKLSQCDMPFQCAHGRPTLTVIKCDSLLK